MRDATGRVRRAKAAMVLGALLAGAAIPGATAQDRQRFAPIPLEKLDAQQRAWADEIAVPPRNAKHTNAPYRAYIRNPELAKRLSNLSDYLRWKTSLPPRLSEMAILITAREWTAQYEWFAHYPLALKGGLAPEVADAIATGKRPATMKPDETALYDLVTELYRDKALSDATFAAAQGQFGEAGILDIIGIIGYYDLVSMALITMQAVPPNDSVKPLAPLARKP
jgi:4-carboxymuconolactone decarboxylase